MILFFDTNMLVDYALKRSTGLPLEISFIMYWTKRSQIKLNDKLIEYLSTITIANSDKNTFLNGLNPSFDNLEDSYQYLTAVQKNVIIGLPQISLVLRQTKNTKSNQSRRWILSPKLSERIRN